MPKRDLDSGLSKPASPQMVEGRGYFLSTEINQAAPPPPPPAPEPEPKLKLPAVLRESAKVDKELIRQYKVLAAQEKRKIYELMDEALRYWLEIHKSTKG
jgi:hypothetical protein